MNTWNVLKDNPENLPEPFEAVLTIYFLNNGHRKYVRIPAYINFENYWRVWTFNPTTNAELITDKVVAWQRYPKLPTEFDI